MYFPSDKLYIETKLIKLGKKAGKREFQKLTNWAEHNLNVTILNASFSLKNRNTLPSLHIVFELQKDYNQLHGDPEYPYNQKYNKLIASNFLRITEELKIEGFANYQGKDFHMSYSVFSKVALIECLNKLNKSDINRIKEKYLSEGLWEISINHGSVIIFYTTENEIESNNKSGVSKEIENKIKELAHQYDEFRYLEKEPFFLAYDSKENFDKKYKGDWYNYYR